MGSGKQTPEVRFEIVPAVEAVMAMASASERRREYDSKEPSQSPSPPEIDAWLEEIDKTISPFLKADLELVFSTETMIIFLLYFIIENNIYTIDDLVAGLRELEVSQFLTRIKDRLLKSADTDDWLSVENIEKVLEKDRAQEIVPFREEAEKLVNLLSEPMIVKERIVGVIDEFSRRYLDNGMNNASAYIEDHIRKLDPLLKEQTELVLDRLSRGNFDTLLAGAPEVRLFPVYHDYNETTILMPGEVYFIYGIGHSERVFSQDDGDRTDELVKAIGDPNRLSILRLLRVASLYGKEIADKLGISPATASYHIDKLVKAELIRIENPEGRRFYYTLNPHGIEDLINGLGREFLQK